MSEANFEVSRQWKMPKIRYILAAVTLAGAAGLWFGRETKTAVADKAGVGVEHGALPRTLVAPGRVESARDPVKLAFESPGRIVEILVDEGDTVTANQVIARLDDRIARARVAAAEAGLAQAKARYMLARRGPRKEDLDAAKAEVEAAIAAANHRGAEMARSEKLGKAGAVADSVVDADGAAAKVAVAQANAANARYQSLSRGTRTETIDEAAAAITLAQAELDAANVALDQTTLRAPNAGMILRRTAEVGTLVTTMQPVPVVTLADVKQLEIRVEVDEVDIAAISVGQRAYATADAYGERRFPVRVVRITNELGRKTVRDDDPRARVDTRVLEVIVQFEKPPTESFPLGLRTSIHVDR